MGIKKTPAVKAQMFKTAYLATNWEGVDDGEELDCYYFSVGRTAEEAAKKYSNGMENPPKYVYVLSAQLKAVTTYK